MTAGGETWTVAAEEFPAIYKPNRGDVGWYRATGTVWARAAQPGEVISGPGGMARAVGDDKVVRADSGFIWLVPRGRFRSMYSPID